MYCCEFPECKYITLNRFQIHYHHIISVKDNGTNKPKNRIWLCPVHHNQIYIPNSKRGIHSIKTENSIILLGWLQSTSGQVLEYIDINGNINYYKRPT
jgi:hypothetical protein